MKQQVKIISNLNAFLNIVIKPILENPHMLQNGRKLRDLGLLPREAVGLFMVCAVGNFKDKSDWTIGDDPDVGDGVVISKKGERAGDAFALEQVYIPPFSKGALNQLVLERVKNKSAKGKEYGKDRSLLIFTDKKGKLSHRKIKELIKDNDVFDSIWLLARKTPKEWIYWIFVLKSEIDAPLAYEIKINKDFKSWKVSVAGRIE
jgi:hypothetical protein